MLTESVNGIYAWLRTSDGLPLEIERSNPDGSWRGRPDSTEPIFIASVGVSSHYRFRKTGEAWLPSDNGLHVIAAHFTPPPPSPAVSTYRFFEQPALPSTTVDANAGGDKTVASGGTVTLDGSAAVSNGSGDTTYAWTRVSGAGGALSAANVARPDFTAPVLAQGAADREIVWRFTATNNGVSDTDDVTVTVEAPAVLAAPNFADDTGDAAAWTQDTAIAPITVPAATGNPAATYAVVGALPAGIAFDPATRRITGTPTAVGNGTIRIRATNTQGSDDWTVAYATTERVGHQVTFVIGDGTIAGVTNRLNWPRVANVNRGTIPANMMVSGAAAQLRSFEVYATGITGLEIAPPNRLSSAIPEDGQDLIASVENFDPAFVLEAGGRRLELPGPGVAGIVFRDPNERYFYNVGGQGQQAFMTAYFALTQVQRNATKLTITDETLVQPLRGNNPSAGTPKSSARLLAPLAGKASGGDPSARLQLGGPLGLSGRAAAGTPEARGRVLAPLAARAAGGGSTARGRTLAPFSARPRAGAPMSRAELVYGFRGHSSAGIPSARLQLGGPLTLSGRATASRPAARARLLAPMSARASAGMPAIKGRLWGPLLARATVGLPSALARLTAPLTFSGAVSAGIPRARVRFPGVLTFSARPRAGVPSAFGGIFGRLVGYASAGMPAAVARLLGPLRAQPEAAEPQARARMPAPVTFAARPSAGVPTARAYLPHLLQGFARAGTPTARAKLGGPLTFLASPSAGTPTAVFSEVAQELPLSPADTTTLTLPDNLTREHVRLSLPDFLRILHAIAGGSR